MIVKAKAGDSLCSIAMAHGFLNCDSIRGLPTNAPFETLDVLEAGSQVEVPARDCGQDLAECLQRTAFKLLGNEPSIEFVQENPALADTVTLSDDDEQRVNRPATLAISNYVSDRCGAGSNGAADELPSANFFGRRRAASRDPDHFKVQVFDPSIPVGTDHVAVKLVALRPGYFQKTLTDAAGRSIPAAQAHPTRFRRPTHDTSRFIFGVKCLRIGTTPFFRSPYLRLVTYEKSSANRSAQCLLVSDYLGDVTLKTHERVHTEILHQRIEAHYKLAHCAQGVCGVSAILPLKSDAGVKLNVRLFSFDWSAEAGLLGGMMDAVRIATLKHARRILAAAHVRPHIAELTDEEMPGNLLFLHRRPAAPTATGPSTTNKHGKPSRMSFFVEAPGKKKRKITLRPEPGTFNDLAKQIKGHERLAGLDIKLRPVPGMNVIDMVFFDAIGNRVRVSDARSNDTHVALEAIGGQDWWLDSAKRFKVEAGLTATSQQRALHWNFVAGDGLTVHVVPTLAIASGAGRVAFGAASLGAVAGSVSAIGPGVFLARAPLVLNGGDCKMPHVLAHEIGHVLMHCGHSADPPKDVVPTSANAPDTTELMENIVDNSDAHDTARHISDAPIATSYHLMETGATTMINGPTTSPVARMRRFGPALKLLRNNEPVLVDALAKGTISTNPNDA